jgi:hypothetical protein
MGWLRSRLLRLYPAEWRARYGEEFEALLEQQRVSLGTVLDVLAGALDSHLERGRGGSTMADRVLRSPPALVLVIGSLPWVLMSLVPFQHLPTWLPIYTVLRVGLVVMAVAVVSLALLHERGRSWVLFMAALAAVGLLAEAATNIAGLRFGPWFGNLPVWDGPAEFAATVAQAAFALAALRTGTLPRIPLIGIAIFSLTIAAAPFLGPSPLSYGYWIAAGLQPLAWLALGVATLLFRARAVAIRGTTG